MPDGVVVTGVGAVTSVGEAEAFLQRVGSTDAATGPEENVLDLLASSLSTRERRRQDLVTQLATLAAREAINDAAWAQGVAPCSATRAACIIGTAFGPSSTIHEQYDAFRLEQRISGLTSAWIFPNMPTANIAIEHGLLGESFGVAAGLTSGTQAIGHAMRLLAAGELDVVLAGGSDARPPAAHLAGLDAQGLLSADDRARPFQALSGGLAPRSGAGVLVLEREVVAQTRGARIYARVRATAARAARPGAWPEALTRVLHAAAGKTPAVHLVLQGLGLPVLDLLEDRAATSPLTEEHGCTRISRPRVSTPAGVAGHTAAASGALSVILAMNAMTSGTVPPVTQCDALPGLRADYAGGCVSAGLTAVASYDPFQGAAAVALRPW